MATLWCNDICFENIAAVLFDKDGTLADSHAFLKTLAITRSQQLEQRIPGIAPQLMAAFGCQGKNYNTAGLMAVGTRYENEIAAATYVAAAGYAWGEALEIARTAFRASDRHFSRKAQFTPPFPGIATLLQNLHAAEIKLGILSGDTTANVQDFIACYGFQPLITWCAGSEQPPAKPDPQMLWNACQKLSVTPDQSLIIGDSVLDQQLACQGQSKAFISVTWGGSSAIASAVTVLNSPEQLRLQPE